ncbi:MAG: hydrolase [Peptococcales bacterium]|jgi:nicotinamidase-related amidase
MRIIKEQSALLLIDVQERLYPHMVAKEQLENNLKILIQGMKVLDVPILVTQQYTKGLGPTIQPILETLGDFAHIEKIAFSCCDEAKVQGKLNILDKKFILVAGVETHVCVLQTVIDLLAAGYIPVLIEDCVSSRKEKDKEIALRRMEKEGAIITTYESILFELLRYAGTEQFKAISRLVK